MERTCFFRKLTTRPTLFLVLAGLLVMAIAAPAAGAQNRPDHAGTSPIDQLRDSLSIDLHNIDVLGGDYGAGTFNGSFNINSFDVDNGQLFAIGNLVGAFTPDVGDVVPFDESNVAVPVTTGNGFNIAQENNDVCPILFLELGPVFLDVLGLVVEIPDPIVLDIYAERGPGKLLGNLLCAIVGLLDGPTDGGGVLGNLLNQINNLLNRLLG
jgi:hypothetical protein